MKDVSSRAGVSVYTASRALSGHSDVSEATRIRVQEAARRLGYVPNQHARNLKGGASRVLGVIAASKANQYYATLVGAIETAVEAFGYSCFVADAAAGGVYLREREDRIIHSMIQQRVVAVVVTYAIDEKNLALLAAWNIPVMFVDCLPSSTGNAYSSVTTDNYSASVAVGNHLASLGYRRWCFVGHARNWNTREPRQAGFEAAAASCGASLEVVEGGNDAEVARRALTTVLARLCAGERPHAVFASNTVLLKGVLLALRDCGLEVPRQMAVVAFDDFDWAQLISPPVTVVDQHIELIGRTAGSRVLTLLGDVPADGETSGRVVIAPTLIVRQSCGARLASAERPGADEAPRRRRQVP
ncbi:MAG: LacI family DNA-binding transcriptional regulator [Hyphomicrobiales bacterium]|nr:LacI family DNA-binding transcriptional regulator [Hyphomicrobiales bacterium]